MNLPSFSFRVLSKGVFEKNQVHVSWNDRTAPPSPEIQSDIDTFWQKNYSGANEKDFVYNGDLCRVVSWQAADGRFELELAHTDYKTLLYSNHVNRTAEDNTRVEFVARALGISAILVTADQQFLLIKRSDRVGEGPGKLDVVGGHVEPIAHLVAGVPDPFLGIAEELREEVGFSPERMSCIGLLETVDTRKPEMVFFGRTEQTAAEVFKAASACACDEIAELLAVANDRQTLAALLESRFDRFTAAAAGCVFLYLQLMEELS